MNGHELFQNIDEKKIARATLKISTKLFSALDLKHTQKKKTLARPIQQSTFPNFSKTDIYYILLNQVWVLQFFWRSWLGAWLTSWWFGYIAVFFPFTLQHNFLMYIVLMVFRCRVDGQSKWIQMWKASFVTYSIPAFLFNVFINNGARLVYFFPVLLSSVKQQSGSGVYAPFLHLFIMFFFVIFALSFSH